MEIVLLNDICIQVSEKQNLYTWLILYQCIKNLRQHKIAMKIERVKLIMQWI